MIDKIGGTVPNNPAGGAKVPSEDDVIKGGLSFLDKIYDECSKQGLDVPPISTKEFSDFVTDNLDKITAVISFFGMELNDFKQDLNASNAFTKDDKKEITDGLNKLTGGDAADIVAGLQAIRSFLTE